ncbi:MAG: hypothetical protein K6E62_10445 [Lachnospiraceae bacterium]|nr:hypothetical protein [Lachnospiraceae bacterium]
MSKLTLTYENFTDHNPDDPCFGAILESPEYSCCIAYLDDYDEAMANKQIKNSKISVSIDPHRRNAFHIISAGDEINLYAPNKFEIMMSMWPYKYKFNSTNTQEIAAKIDEAFDYAREIQEWAKKWLPEEYIIMDDKRSS